MAVALDLIQHLQDSTPAEAWTAIFTRAWEVCSPAIEDDRAEAEITRRDRTMGEIDLYLATAAWDLWNAYEESVEQTSDALATWWSDRSNGRAVLILDGLSLRELPWLVSGAKERGFTVHSTRVTGAELPADTTPFAKALGFGQRSALANNGAGGTHRLPGARTESVDIAWQDCSDLVGSEPDWVLWHHWPDHRLHDHDDPGKGLSSLTTEVVQHLASDEFWSLVGRLAHGRRLVITSDHGYAASGLFPDSNKEQTEYLKRVFKSGRWNDTENEAGSWVPPIDLYVQTRHHHYLFVNGRRKWKSAGGYPTLTHGGLTVLEVAVPFIELSMTAEA